MASKVLCAAEPLPTWLLCPGLSQKCPICLSRVPCGCCVDAKAQLQRRQANLVRLGNEQRGEEMSSGVGMFFWFYLSMAS